MSEQPRAWSTLPDRIRLRLSVTDTGEHWHWQGADQIRPRVKWRDKVVDVPRLLGGLLGRDDVWLQRRCADPVCVNPAHGEMVPWREGLRVARLLASNPTTIERVLKGSGIEPRPEDRAPGIERDRLARRRAAFEAFHHGESAELLPRTELPRMVMPRLEMP